MKNLNKILGYWRRKFLVTVVLLILVTLSLTCKKETPSQPYISPIELSAEDVSCTEAWLRIKTTKTFNNATLKLIRDGKFESSILNPESLLDTLIVDEGLLPKQTYTYKAFIHHSQSKADPPLEDNTPLLHSDSSDALIVTTMDTTTHDFSWEIFYLGDGAGSCLYDVAIVNDTCIYGVGEINVKDSLGNWINPPYNFAKWNGTKWKLSTCTETGYGYGANYAIIAFSENDIWVGGTIPKHWNGVKWTFYGLARGYPGGFYINKIWGTSSSNLYIVGTGGNIIHYDGRQWRRLESGTELGLLDIYGLSSEEIHACGSHWGEVRGVVLKKQGNNFSKIIEGEILIDTTELFKTKLYGITRGLWIDEKGTLYTVGNLMYQYKQGKWGYVKSLPGNSLWGNPGYLYRGFLHSVRGNASNDMFIFGEINTIRHFNGVSWAEVGPPYYPLKYDMFWYSCAVKGNLAVGVGKISSERKAMVIILKR